jgi:hypothetical protein
MHAYIPREFQVVKKQKVERLKWLTLEYKYSFDFLENSIIGSHLKFSIFFD